MHRHRLLYNILIVKYRYSMEKLGCMLDPQTSIGPGLYLLQFPFTKHTNAVIGERCVLHKGVHIGSSRTKKGAPIIGNYCFLGNGCHIIGNCKIGDWCFISPGAFICKDIPSGSVVGFGVNNIISQKGKETVKLYL